MVKISLAYGAFFLVLLSRASQAYGIGTQGQENRPHERGEAHVNDDIVTARTDLEHARQQLLTQNEIFLNLLEEVRNISAQFKTLGAGAAPEEARRIVQERNALMRKIERLVVRIREQEERVNELARAHARLQLRLHELERALEER